MPRPRPGLAAARPGAAPGAAPGAPGALRHRVRRAAPQGRQAQLPQEHPLEQPRGAAGGRRRTLLRNDRTTPGRVDTLSLTVSYSFN